MSAEEGHLFRDATLFTEGDDCKGTTAASLPVHRDIFRVRLRGVSACSAS